jgi:hypothetical protein
VTTRQENVDYVQSFATAGLLAGACSDKGFDEEVPGGDSTLRIPLVEGPLIFRKMKMSTWQVAKLKAKAFLAAPFQASTGAELGPRLRGGLNEILGGVDASVPPNKPKWNGDWTGTGPLPEDTPANGFNVLPWEREAFSQVNINPADLDTAFTNENGALLEAKMSKYDESQRKDLMAKKTPLEILNMAAKDLDKFFAPPPAKKKEAAKDPDAAKKAPDAAKKAPAAAKKAPAAATKAPAAASKKAPAAESA